MPFKINIDLLNFLQSEQGKYIIDHYKSNFQVYLNNLICLNIAETYRNNIIYLNTHLD